MASQNSKSNAASMEAILFAPDTDDEAELSAADQNSASSDVASMVAVKTEYNSDTDDEAATAADKNSASGAASMVAVKKEYDADNDSDEENQPPIKKAKKGDNEHGKHIAEIRKITDQLLSRGRQHDATVMMQIRQIAHDLKSFVSELNKSADGLQSNLIRDQWQALELEDESLTPERKEEIKLTMTLLVHASTCTEVYCAANCAKMKALLKHGTTCKVKGKGGCNPCKRACALLQIHVKGCKQENCPVPNCMAIRERVRQIRLQQKAKMIDEGK